MITAKNLKRTKIVATAGPATDDPKVLIEMMKAGLSVVRLNASHGSRADLKRRLDLVRAAAATAQECVGLLLDLSGPKIRIEGFANGPIQLEEGAAFALDTALDPKVAISTWSAPPTRISPTMWCAGMCCCSPTARSCWTCLPSRARASRRG